MSAFTLLALAAISLQEMPGHTTEATVDVDAPPAVVYALVTDYARWPQLLGDVRSVKVERGGPRDARVKFRSEILDHTVTVLFDNDPDRSIKFIGVEGPPGGRARGSYLLEPIDGGRRTRVHASLFLDVVGPAGVFVTDSKLRRMREAKLRADLTDVAAAAARQESGLDARSGLP
jgi:uncharacterized membrane protein